MRPLRLLLDGFGCYREPAEADFSDVDFFALVGPTGAGKSTVIDGLCFALYGTVPRWGKENAIAQALAPAANACRVCLVFESAGKRYGIARALTRDARGQVHTKSARLELLDPEVPQDAPIADILAASVEALAEGPDDIKARVQDILGLSYEHFTQSVLLPQGRFADFLQAEPRKRQDLLVELLAFGVYERVGQQARKRADLAADRVRNAEHQRADLADATHDSETSAAARVARLQGLTQKVDAALGMLGQLSERAERAALAASDAREAAGLLAAVQMPADVPGLARRITEADQLLAERKQQWDAAENAEAAARQARGGLPDRTRMEVLRRAYGDQRDLAAQLERLEREHAARKADHQARAAELQAGEGSLRQAREARALAEREHAAAALAKHLHVGQDCPVCLRPVTSLPHHTAPADLAKASAVVEAADERLRQARSAYDLAAVAAVAAGSAVDGTRQQLQKISATLAGAPAEADVAASIDAIVRADEALGLAQEEAKARRAGVATAERDRSSLDAEERQARAGLSRARDSVVGFGAPDIENADLAAAWAALTRWAQAQHEERSMSQSALDAAASSLRAEVAGVERTVGVLLTDHGITEAVLPGGAAAVVATHAERAANHLAGIRDRREKAEKLDRQIHAHRAEQQVAAKLGQLLRATSFERWLCGEALDSLVAEASDMLLKLSAGQYELDRDERNELRVIDHQDAGASRPVRTLSGGETFQASLALALALSRQVIGLSAGKRDLNSMFLDEGFGTLDEDTLETVGSTLERLAADSDRMIGVITHVPALAQRVSVRFVVSRTGTTSALRKERG